MKRICFFLMIFLASACSLVAQELSGDSPWENNDSPWENNASQTNVAPSARQTSSTSGVTSTARTTTSTTYPPKPPKTTGTPGTSSTPAPIDGGLLALLAAGAVYGGKRLRNRERKPVS